MNEKRECLALDMLPDGPLPGDTPHSISLVRHCFSCQQSNQTVLAPQSPQCCKCHAPQYVATCNSHPKHKESSFFSCCCCFCFLVRPTRSLARSALANESRGSMAHPEEWIAVCRGHGRLAEVFMCQTCLSRHLYVYMSWITVQVLHPCSCLVGNGLLMDLMQVSLRLRFKEYLSQIHLRLGMTAWKGGGGMRTWGGLLVVRQGVDWLVGRLVGRSVGWRVSGVRESKSLFGVHSSI